MQAQSISLYFSQGSSNKEYHAELVLDAEVSTDHITANLMRHGARLLRFRQDKRPEDCHLDQIG